MELVLEKLLNHISLDYGVEATELRPEACALIVPLFEVRQKLLPDGLSLVVNLYVRQLGKGVDDYLEEVEIFALVRVHPHQILVEYEGVFGGHILVVGEEGLILVEERGADDSLYLLLSLGLGLR